MSKQEEIKEHLVELFEQTDFSKETPEQLADAVLWVESEDGVVIKAEGVVVVLNEEYYARKRLPLPNVVAVESLLEDK